MVSITEFSKASSPGKIHFPHDKSEQPFAIQLLGNAQSNMKSFFDNLETQDVGIIDLNLSCAARSALVNNTGGALLRKSGKAAAFADAVIKYAPVPVTAKMRSGWSREENYGVQIAQELERSGIAAITVHGCSVKAKYTVPSNPKYIHQIQEAVKIPVIANGDIKTPADMSKILADTGAAGVMIGRASIGNPYIFAGLSGNVPNQYVSLPRDIKPLWLLLDYLKAGSDHAMGVEFPRARHFLYLHLRDQARKQVLRGQLDAIQTLEDFFIHYIPKYPKLAQHPLAKNDLV